MLPNFSKSLPIVFLRDIHEGHLSIEETDNKQGDFAKELKNFDKGIKTLEKNSFLNNLGLLYSAREKVLNSFKSRLFPIKDFNKIPTHKPATEPEVVKEPATEPQVATKATKSKTIFIKIA